MKKLQIVLCAGLIALAAMAGATTVSMKISGPGAVNDSTIKAGEKVSFDLYFTNDKQLKGVSLGFKLYSKDIKTIVHVADSGKGLDKAGDVKGWNGWNDKSLWDFGGIWPALKNWDGNLPDTIGFAGLVAKKPFYAPHPIMKTLSFDVIVPTPGTIAIDTTFYPPGGSWKAVVVGNVNELPAWKGPYKWHVVK